MVDALGQGDLAVFADGELLAEVRVDGFTRAKLPHTTAALRWSVELAGTATVRRVSLATSFAEVNNG